MTISKKWLLIGFGFGLGIVVGCALIGSVLWWHTHSRAKHWNTEAIRTEYSTVSYMLNEDGEVGYLTEDYILENASSSDYTLSASTPLMILYRGSYEPNGSYRVYEDCFVPAGQKVRCGLRVPKWYDTTTAVEGFVVFDTQNRYKIVFSKPTFPSPDEKKSAESAIKNKK